MFQQYLVSWRVQQVLRRDLASGSVSLQVWLIFSSKLISANKTSDTYRYNQQTP